MFALWCSVLKERGRRLQTQASAHDAYHTVNDMCPSPQIIAEAAFIIL